MKTLRLIKLSAAEAELLDLRAGALICSLTASQARFQEARAYDEAARRCYDESCLLDTDGDDWMTAHAAFEKQERIDEEYIASAPFYQNTLIRLGWEMREARKAGVHI
jgi:hypothetical protein